jgi:hypothetical protein
MGPKKSPAKKAKSESDAAASNKAAASPPGKKSNRNDNELPEVHIVVHTVKDLDHGAQADQKTVVGIYKTHDEAEVAARSYAETDLNWEYDENAEVTDGYEIQDDYGNTTDVVGVESLTKGKATDCLFRVLDDDDDDGGGGGYGGGYGDVYDDDDDGDDDDDDDDDEDEDEDEEEEDD